MGNDILGIFDPHEKYGFSGERGTEMANFNKRYECLADAEMRRFSTDIPRHILDGMRWPERPTTLGPNQLAWCRDNLRGFAMKDAE